MMMSAVGRKKNTAASTHKLMDEVPLCAAAAIQRGPSTAAMLKSSTSQKPMARRNCDFGAVSSAICSFQVAVAWVRARAIILYGAGKLSHCCTARRITAYHGSTQIERIRLVKKKMPHEMCGLYCRLPLC